ncbi:MAG: FAD-dependent oxidoreductase [bacterium]|nr:FAD-dependent oxidoreductase [bacterium]
MEIKKYDFVVLGAGVAGLSFAWKMAKNGKTVLVLEKESVVGGLSRTIEHEGFLMDFSAHRFHSKNKELLDTIFSLPGLEMKKHVKKSRIYLYNKFLKYPFELTNLLRAMPIKDSLLCGADYLLNRIRTRHTKLVGRSYKDWFVYYYGTRLYEIMCYRYTSKIWGMDPATISADWADARFQGEDLQKLIKRAVLKLLTFNFSRYDLADDSLAPDGGEFYYPDLGIQELPDAFARNLKALDGDIKLTATVTKILTNEKLIEYSYEGEKQIVSYGSIISTIPLTMLYQLRNRLSGEIKKLLGKTSYMDIIFVYVFLNQDHVSNDHWMYFPDSNIPFNRSVEFTNWSKKMAPAGKTCLCLDITCYFGDPVWNKTDEQHSEDCISVGDRIGLFKKANVMNTYVKRIRYAYPVYDLDYRSRLEKVVGFLEQNNTFLLGRTGIFRYNNSDNSIEMAFQLAQNFIDGAENKSIFEYKIKQISL